MADITISELATMVGVPVERLLEQVKEADLPQKKADDTISNDERAKLLMSLKSKHGEDTSGGATPRRITLKRKTVDTLKTTDNQGRSKAVNVEVRRKRTYVKRSVEEAQIEADRKEAERREKEAKEQAEREAREKARQAEEAKAAEKDGSPAKSTVSLKREAPRVTAEVPVDDKTEVRRDHKKGTARKEVKREEPDAPEKKRPASS